jgi:hypothetical protein
MDLYRLTYPSSQEWYFAHLCASMDKLSHPLGADIISRSHRGALGM